MNKFEIELDEDYLIAIGKITVNFATLEQVISLFIWNLIEYDNVAKLILLDSPTELSRSWIEYLMCNRYEFKRESPKKLGQILTVNLSFRQKIDLLSALLKYNNNGLHLIDLEQALNKAIQAEQKRNTIVHSVWAKQIMNYRIARIKAIAKKNKGLKVDIEEISAKNLEEIADFIANTAYDIQTLVIQYYNPDFYD
jgi:hypothetical protein